jgi:hypothetical protein
MNRSLITITVCIALLQDPVYARIDSEIRLDGKRQIFIDGLAGSRLLILWMLIVWWALLEQRRRFSASDNSEISCPNRGIFFCAEY